MQFMAADSGEYTIQDTQRGSPRRLIPRGTQDACLVHIYPSGADMGRRYPLAGHPVTLGRQKSALIPIVYSFVHYKALERAGQLEPSQSLEGLGESELRP